MDKVPFSVYDFFAYLASGAVLLATADYVFGFGFLTLKDVPVPLAVVVLVLAYVCGHVVSHFASLLLEHLAVKEILGQPVDALLGELPRAAFLKWFFPNYFRPLPEEIRQLVRARASGFVGKGEALFLHAYGVVTSKPEIQARLDTFRNQYSFARNMALAFMLSAICIFVSHWREQKPAHGFWAACVAVVAVTLFYRFLKFYRQYSYEVLVRYAAQSGLSAGSGGA